MKTFSLIFLIQRVKNNSKMYTRSQAKYDSMAIYSVDIDFDGASDAWRANKKSIGNGHYKYICIGITKTGNGCKRESLAGCNYCSLHSKKCNSESNKN